MYLDKFRERLWVTGNILSKLSSFKVFHGEDEDPLYIDLLEPISAGTFMLRISFPFSFPVLSVKL